mgnify:CR=1 FL=1
MASNKYPHLQNQCEHLIRGIPNNILTRWIVKRINIWMKKSDSRHRLHRRYRTPRKGGYTMYGDVNCANARTFSIYLRSKPIRRMDW